jgi:hypothetical protein
MKVHSLRPEYVEFMPRTIEQGVIYVSKKFKTATHLCCCGCGTKIVTPLRETEYRLREKDGQVSLSPSIGNWNHPCQSHYWIRNNDVIWAGAMSQAAIDRGRALDDDLKDAYFHRWSRPWWFRAVRRAQQWLASLLK